MWVYNAAFVLQLLFTNETSIAWRAGDYIDRVTKKWDLHEL